jgi:hypothetical protein
MYRLTCFFTGRQSSIDVEKESLRVKLLRNNTVLIAAALDVAVPARTWIWKGINFGFLGCLKISSCGGQIVTYSAHIDMKVAFQGTGSRKNSVPLEHCVVLCLKPLCISRLQVLAYRTQQKS